MNIIEDAIGTGPTFPINLSGTEGLGWETSPGSFDTLKNDLLGLLSQSVGLKPREESMGHRLEELLEEPNTYIVKQLVKKFCAEYINRTEYRIVPLASKDIDVVVTSTTIAITLHIALVGGAGKSELSLNINK